MQVRHLHRHVRAQPVVVIGHMVHGTQHVQRDIRKMQMMMGVTVIQTVPLYQTHRQPRPVHVRATLTMEHVRTVVQHKHVMVNIRLAVVPLRGQHVLDARHGVNVLVVQKVLHVMRGII